MGLMEIFYIFFFYVIDDVLSDFYDLCGVGFIC